MDQLQKVQELEEVEYEGPISIQNLETQGIANNDIQKLINHGFHSIESIVFMAKKNLTFIKGLSEAKIDKICEAGFDFQQPINYSPIGL